jgi:hypothetical protein
MIQDLEMRQAKIGQAIRLLREAGLEGYAGGMTERISPSGTEPTKTGRTMSAEAKAAIGLKMRLRWAEKRAQGQNMNPNQPPKARKLDGRFRSVALASEVG